MTPQKPLEQLVCSLELSEQLRDASVFQESNFYWLYNPDKSKYEVGMSNWSDGSGVATFTAEEILGRLPKQDWGFPLSIRFEENCWAVFYGDDRGAFLNKAYVKDKSLANAAAKMELYLIKNKLI